MKIILSIILLGFYVCACIGCAPNSTVARIKFSNPEDAGGCAVLLDDLLIKSNSFLAEEKTNNFKMENKAYAMKQICKQYYHPLNIKRAPHNISEEVMIEYCSSYSGEINNTKNKMFHVSIYGLGFAYKKDYEDELVNVTSNIKKLFDNNCTGGKAYILIEHFFSPINK